MHILRPCKTTAAFEAVPPDERRVDLDAAEAVLIGKGWELVVNAAVMLIVRKEVECSLYPSGKILLKTREASEARRATEAILSDLGETVEIQQRSKPAEVAA